MFERLLRFSLSTVIVLFVCLNGIVIAEPSAIPLGSTGVATSQSYLEAPSESESQRSTANAASDCSSRNLTCHCDWFGPLEANSVRSFETDLPSQKKKTLQINSWLPGVLRKPPRV